MNPDTAPAPNVRLPPPSKHQLALMIWLAVFPTLTTLNLMLGDWLSDLPTVSRTFVLATVAVPIVICGVILHLHRARARLLRRSRPARPGAWSPSPGASPTGGAPATQRDRPGPDGLWPSPGIGRTVAG